jgi:ribosomal protein RSM22 (predicted rRNA methylase)
LTVSTALIISKVLIDHSTTAGFEAIAEARQYLLNMGSKGLEDAEADYWPVRGSHVVAPVSSTIGFLLN